jgi:hypothetical protein
MAPTQDGEGTALGAAGDEVAIDIDELGHRQTQHDQPKSGP